MKYEWKKQEKNIYLQKETPTFVTVPKHKYFTIEGEGNPNGPGFSDKIGTLYSLAYAVRMMPKKGITPEGYFEYTVYPLEGVWDLNDKAKQAQKQIGTFDKEDLVYKIMIRQPDFVNEEVVKNAFEIVRKKENSPQYDQVKFEEIEDGPCVQILHVGSYDDEPRSFDQMKAFITENGRERRALTHREIYLSDFRKVSPEKLKTVLRYFITE